MFSGQGSQYYHMGEKLFDTDITFRKYLCEMDEIVKSVQGVSVIDDLYNKKYKLFDPFVSLRLTHPAIFMVGYAMAKVLEKQGITPDYVLGCSLGEFTAAAIAGVWSPEDALRAVMKQAEIVEKSCKTGRMVAVLRDIDLYHNTEEMKSNCALASINAPSQFVISGEGDRVDLVKKFMKSNDILHQELMVSYGFHSPAINPSEMEYRNYLRTLDFKRPSIPMISGVYGGSVTELPGDYFWDVLRNPTIFSKAIESLENSIGKGEDLMYIDAGTGSLASLIKYNVKKESRSKGFQIVTPFQQEVKKLEEVKSYFKENKVSSAIGFSKKGQLTACVFPGQGSQRRGMGEDLFDAFPELTARASEILGYSIRQLCVDDPERNLNKTQYTQPALYVVNALSFLKMKEDSGVVPDFLAGHSLGEYNALFAAGAFDFETGVKLVRKRGAVMAKMKEGGMAAVKGLTEEQIEHVIERHGLREIDMANYNTQNQIVLSGSRDVIARSGPFFEAAGATLYFPLNVNGAFHSRYMMPAKIEFQAFLSEFTFSALKIPVVSNVEATFYPNDDIKALLADQLTKPVRWTESITFLLGKGDVSFREVGPGDVLTKLIWRIKQDLQEVVQ